VPAGLFILLITICLPLSGISSRQTIEFSRIRPEYRETNTFKRISEYFTGDENTSKRTVFRTQDGVRDGFYFSFRIEVEKGGLVPAGTVALLVFTPGTYEPTEYVFDLEAQSRRWIEVIIGLTGTDWKDPEAKPVAWRLEFRDETGQSIGSEEDPRKVFSGVCRRRRKIERPRNKVSDWNVTDSSVFLVLCSYTAKENFRWSLFVEGLGKTDSDPIQGMTKPKRLNLSSFVPW
jgi:hypothetical protein